MDNLFSLKFKTSKSVFIGAGAVMLAAFLWSLDGMFIRPQFYVLPAPLVVFWEHCLGFILLSPFLFAGWSKLKTLRLKDWGAVIWVCFFGGMIGTIMITEAFFAAVHGEVTFATVVILQKLQPIFALVLARVILKERLSGKFYLWALGAVAAAYVLAFAKDGLDITRIDLFHHAAFFAFLAAFSFGSSTVFGKRVVNHIDYKLMSVLRFGITGLMVLVLLLITGKFLECNQINVLQWKLLVVIVLTSGAGAIFLYYYGLKKIPASLATICELFWPFSAVILDYILNGNLLTGLQIPAFFILLFCFYLAIVESKKINFGFKARVIKGEGRGRKLGFPTANLDKTDLPINFGVYKVEAVIDDKWHLGLLHYGIKETFNNKRSTELLVRNLEQNLYGKEVSIKIIKRVRDIKKFKDISEFKKQVEKDAKEI